MNEIIISTIHLLFNYYWDSEMTEEEETEKEESADKLIDEYGWEVVFENFFYYLKKDCPTPESVVNAVNNYQTYHWNDYPIQKPYEFLGYIYYRIDLNPSKYDGEYNAISALDSLSVDVLKNAGISGDFRIGDYVPETDTKLIEAVQRWKIQNETN